MGKRLLVSVIKPWPPTAFQPNLESIISAPNSKQDGNDSWSHPSRPSTERKNNYNFPEPNGTAYYSGCLFIYFVIPIPPAQTLSQAQTGPFSVCPSFPSPKLMPFNLFLLPELGQIFWEALSVQSPHRDYFLSGASLEGIAPSTKHRWFCVLCSPITLYWIVAGAGNTKLSSFIPWLGRSPVCCVKNSLASPSLYTPKAEVFVILFSFQ